MLSYVLIPFVLALNVYVGKEQVYLPKQYVFDFKNIIHRQRVSLEHKYMSSKLTCLSPSLRDTYIRCYLKEVRHRQPDYIVKQQNSKFISVQIEDDTKYNQTFWFDINLDKHSAYSISVKEEYKKIVKADSQNKEIIIDMIKDIAYLFTINSYEVDKNLIMQSTSGSSVFTSTETTTIGNCETKYNMTVTFNKTGDEPSSIFQIIPTVLLKNSTEKKDMYRYAHVQIEKNKLKCYDTGLFLEYEYEGTLTKHDYKMEMVNGKLKISNIINVRQSPNRWNPNTFVMDQTTLLNLIDIRSTESKETYIWTKYDNWFDITI